MSVVLLGHQKLVIDQEVESSPFFFVLLLVGYWQRGPERASDREEEKLAAASCIRRRPLSLYYPCPQMEAIFTSYVREPEAWHYLSLLFAYTSQGLSQG